MPDLGTTVDSVTLVEWLVKPGDTVKRGDPLANVETDKAVAELESVANGEILELLVENGEVIHAGKVIAYIGGSEQSPLTAAPPVTEREAAKAEATPAAGGEPDPGTPLVSPLVRDLAKSEALDQTRLKYSDTDLLGFYRDMLLIRQVEERLGYLFLEGLIPGTMHQSLGQEAVAVGLCRALRSEDVITSTHRPHAHSLAKGVPLQAFVDELLGKASGCCKGRGGSMHVGDITKGMVPSIAIVGGGIPIAAGIALSFKLRKEDRVAVGITGDGGVAQGAFHEAVNMAAIWNLPVVFVVENNRYAASTHYSRNTKLEQLSDLGAAYGIPSATIDGNNVLDVHGASCAAVERSRAGAGPSILEAVTYRITGHNRRDPCNYMPDDERRQALEHEPVKRFEEYLVGGGHVEQSVLAKMSTEIEADVEAVVEAALKAPDPEPEEAYECVYAERRET